MGGIGFIGGGNMAQAIIAGIIKKGVYAAEDIGVFDIRKERLDHLSSLYGVIPSPSLQDLAERKGVIMLAVKPDKVSTVLSPLETILKDKLVISIAAGITIKTIQTLVGNDARVVRVMPNTPALVLEGVSAVAASRSCTDQDMECAGKIFASIGMCMEMDEGLINAVTALTGSGPAFCFMFMEALSDGAVRAGLPRDTAIKLAAATVKGAASMVLEGLGHPGLLKDMVSSPSGTTIDGIAVLEAKAFRSAVIDAVYAAYKRSVSLGSQGPSDQT